MSNLDTVNPVALKHQKKLINLADI